VSWVKDRVALRATDDPDCKDGIDHASGTWGHVYDRWGDEWGGADEATRVWFRRTKRRFEALVLAASWWAASSLTSQPRAEALADLEDARSFMATRLPEETREFIVPKFDEMVDQADR
jgi:hypothetical protein